MKHLFGKKLWALILSGILTLTAIGPVTVSAKGEDALYELESDELVRVSIVLDGNSTFAAGYRAENLQSAGSAARSYRSAVRTQQDELEKRIEDEVLGGKDLEVKWNLTFLVNIISAVVPASSIQAIKALPGVSDVYRERLYLPAEDDITEIGENPYAYTGTVDPQLLTSGNMIGSYNAYDAGYTGAGSRIAIIDTGIGTNHQSFNGGALEYSLQKNAEALGMSYDAYKSSLNLLTANNISSLSSQLNSKGKSSSYTTKIPYGYNYISENTNISHMNDYSGEHGSHVAGIAAANKYIPDASSSSGYSEALESVYVQGVAPDAQLLIMKVFGYYKENSTNNYDGGAYDSDYMAAIEDALLLGADAINMSLGSAAPGFTEIIGYSYQSILDAVEASGTVLSVSNGNAYNWAHYTDTGMLYADDVNFSIDGTPGSFRETIGVASVENSGFIGSYFDVGTVADVNMDGYMDEDDAVDILYYAIHGKGRLENHLYDWELADLDGDGQVTSYDAHLILNVEPGARIFYGESTDYGNQPMNTINGEQSYILIEGYGTTAEWSALKSVLSGKIAVCSRGSTSFYEKANAAAANGAIGVVIYNNTEGSIGLNLTGYNYTAPVVSISQNQGAFMKASAVKKTLKSGSTTYTYYEGTIKVGSDVTVAYGKPSSPYVMSDFSSWGTPGSLELKPEITAPGGNIFSVNGQHVVYSGGNSSFDYSTFNSADNTTVGSASSYESMSGTSMAAPQVTGMTAVIAQYIRENGLASQTGLRSRVLTHSLMMSTAKPLIDAQTGNYYSVLKQGAGLANVGNAVASKTYILMDSAATASASDGKVKAELGDDPGRSGVYSYSFTIYNMSDEALTYHLDTDLFTQAVETISSVKYLSDDTRGIGADVTYSTGESFTLPANGSQKVTVTMRLTAVQKAEFEAASGAYKDAGAYIEGFTRLTSYDEEGLVTDVDHTIVILGFYGSWTDASMFDRSTYIEYYKNNKKWPGLTPYTFETLDSSESIAELYGLNQTLDMTQYFNNLTYYNPSAWNSKEMPLTGSNFQRTYAIGRFYYRLIRNAGAVVGIIQDSNGNILKTTSVKTNLTALFNYYGYGYLLPDENDSLSVNADYFSHYIDFSTRVSSLSGVTTGSKIKVSVVAIPEYYTKGLTASQMTSTWAQNLINSGVLGAGCYKTIELTVANSMNSIGDEPSEDTEEPEAVLDPEVVQMLRAGRTHSTASSEDNTLGSANHHVLRSIASGRFLASGAIIPDPAGFSVDTENNSATAVFDITNLTNGKQEVHFDPSVLSFASLNGNEAAEDGDCYGAVTAGGSTIYYTYAVDAETGTVTFDFASKTASSGQIAEIVFTYQEENGILTAGETETVISSETIEEGDDFSQGATSGQTLTLGYTMTASVSGGHGTTTADSPLAVEKDAAVSVEAMLESGYRCDYVIVNGTQLTSGVVKENQRVTATFTVTEDSEVIFHTIEAEESKVSVTVTAIWQDDEDRDGIRPDSISVQLYADGAALSDPVELSAANGWRYTWTDLPEQVNGTPVAYTVSEIGVPKGYTASITGAASTGYTLTNTHLPETISVSVTKVWNDADDQDGIRPGSVTVQLLCAGEAYGKEVTLSADNAWTYSWTDLLKNAAGEAIIYTVEETGSYTGYAASVTGMQETGYTVINTHTVYTTKVSVKKNWSDNGNASGVRPASVTVSLFADNVDTGKTLVLNAADSWTGTFNNLPQRKNGKDITYTVTEEDVAGYTGIVTQGISTTFVLTNTINQYTLTFKDGDTVLAEITQDYGTAVSAPEDPKKSFYVFNGWDKEIPKTMPAEDMTIYATWTAVGGYYLTGKMTEWQIEEQYLFAENTQNAGEYYLAAELEEGTEIKVVYAVGGVPESWNYYPSTEHNYNGKTDNYKVDQDHSGSVTIYFRPDGNPDSYWQPFGGYFYIEKDHEVNIQVAEGSGEAYAIRNGNHETTFTAPRLMDVEIVTFPAVHYELDRIELWKKNGSNGPEFERVLDGVIFKMGDYDVIVKVYFKYSDHDLVETKAKDATCTEAGNTAYWTCTICGKYFSDAEGKNEIDKDSWVIAALGHDWKFDKFEWTETADGYTAEAKYICQHDGSHKEGVAAQITKQSTDAGCTEPGTVVYTATVAKDKALDGQARTDTKTVTGQALGHDLVETKAKAATCTEAGNTAYWTCQRCGKYFSDAEGKTEIKKDSWVITALGHEWDTPVVIWDGYEAATAKRTCKHDSSHFETKACTITNEVTTKPTVHEEGLRTYTAIATFDDGVVATDTKTEVIPALGWKWTRLSGDDRFETMEKVLDEAYEDGSCETLIIASGMEYADALAGASLAGVYDCPIILSSDTRLLESTKNEIERLASSKGCEVYILGGPASVSDSVKNAISKLKNITAVSRIYGDDREITAMEIAKKGRESWGDTVILAAGDEFADALAISPYAYAAKAPILLGRGNGTIAPEVKALIEEMNFKKLLIVGGPASITEATEEKLKKEIDGLQVVRLSGDDRFETALKVLKWELGQDTGRAFQPEVEMTADGMGIVSGLDFPDALGSVSILGRTKSVLALVSNASADRPSVETMINEIIAPNASSMEKGYIFGGEASVDKDIAALLAEAVQ